jgi:hypothetical protein
MSSTGPASRCPDDDATDERRPAAAGYHPSSAGGFPPAPPDLPEPGHAGIGSCLLAGAFPLPHCSTAQAATGAGRHRACAQSSGQLPREALGGCGRALGTCRGVLTTSGQVIAAGVRLVRFHPPEARPHALVRPVTGLHSRDWNVSRTAEIP